MSAQIQQRSPKQYLAVCVWLLVGLMFANITSQWIELSSSDKQLTEYAQSAIQVGPLDHRSVKDIRTLIKSKLSSLRFRFRTTASPSAESRRDRCEPSSTTKARSQSPSSGSFIACNSGTILPASTADSFRNITIILVIYSREIRKSEATNDVQRVDAGIEVTRIRADS